MVMPDDLTVSVYTPGRKGTLQSNMIAAVRRHERLAYRIQGLNALVQEVAAGHPVIVFQNLGLRWWPRWHYAVVVGYDLPNQQVVMHTGTTAFRTISLPTFNHTWRRAQQWGLLVLSTETVPISAQLHEYMRAAFGLQKAGRVQAAIRAFKTATQQWPQHAEPWLGLGNVLYASSKSQAAAGAFEQAIAVDPQCAAAFNNLAHILAEDNRLAEAERMARRAVELGGAHSEMYRRTLEEILTKYGRLVSK